MTSEHIVHTAVAAVSPPAWRPSWTNELMQTTRERLAIAGRLQSEGRPDMAADVLVRASSDEPDRQELREAAGRAQFETGRFNGARAAFGGIVALDRKDHFAMFASALSTARSGDLVVAREELIQAVRWRPDLDLYTGTLDLVETLLLCGCDCQDVGAAPAPAADAEPTDIGDEALEEVEPAVQAEVAHDDRCAAEAVLRTRAEHRLVALEIGPRPGEPDPS